jgi:hypothetical protein
MRRCRLAWATGLCNDAHMISPTPARLPHLVLRTGFEFLIQKNWPNLIVESAWKALRLETMMR